MAVQCYDDKNSTYFEGVRADIVARLPEAPNARILEIGCAAGGTGALALRSGKCAEYVGVELHEPTAEIARARLTDVVVGDVETAPLPFEDEAFDALIVSEVFEHLTDPWGALAKIARHLRSGGLVYASSPNVAHHRVIRRQLRGEWPLADKGVMDRTHLRWFTPSSFAEMFVAAGFEVQSIGPVTPPAPRVRFVNAVTGGRLSHLFWTQINIVARKR